MRHVFFGGKGGVGKTTCAAAAAVRAAREGERVLVVSTDPAHSLGDALDRRLGASASKVEERLWAVQLDADRALTRWMKGHEDAFRTIADRGTYLDRDDIDRLLSLSLPGVDELVGLVELERLARADHYDVVVVDTAPTGHTLRLLEMPETLARFARVLDDMHAKHRFLAESLGGRWREDFADAAIAEVEGEASALQKMLARDASFTWVTLPEILSIEESRDGIRRLEELGVRVGRVIFNRMWPRPNRPCVLCTPKVEAEAAVVASFAPATLGIPLAAVEPRGVDALYTLAMTLHPVRPHEAAAERFAPTRAERIELPIPASLILVGGKGGVGKTTTACAIALEIAERKPVLLLSTDPAHSLGDALDLAIGDTPKQIGKQLQVRELDAQKAFEAERDKYRGAIDDLFDSIFRGMDAAFDRAVLKDLLELAPPGLDELFALLAITNALRDNHTIVVDTAPTGHTMRLLALPPLALDWVHAIMQIILKYRKIVGLGELAADLTKLAKDLRLLGARLVDPETTAFVAVTRPADLPRLETERLARRLAELAIPLAAVVVNGVTPDDADCNRCRAARAAEKPQLAKLSKLGAPVVRAPMVAPPPRGPNAIKRWRARFTA